MLKDMKRKHPTNEEDQESENDSQPSKSKEEASDKKIRHYDESYLAVGFTWTGDENCPLPLYIICGRKLANTAMAPVKLKRHFSTNHSYLSNKSVDYFRRLVDSQKKQRKFFEKTLTISERLKKLVI
ncbi:zinc finger BED domain-containing protein 5-like [Macrobrachium nipponense]|uniref:zinc finger BED domain-containing protein 5-like n=1 Tax=Macrobrachium nipponense TaxID=159736 RepID=UPI0030C815B2